ncbi:MAG: flavin reductase family protein [bacterium]
MTGAAARAECSSDQVQEGFREAMRRVAQTVTIISSRNGSGRVGMTATSVASVSMDPPSLLVSVKRTASIHRPLEAVGAFCVNVLNTDQQEHCFDFSGRKEGEARFEPGEWTEEYGLPCLADAQANIFCTVDAMLGYATHTIFVGRVTRVLTRGVVAPLVYLNGGFIPGPAVQ